VLVSQFDPSNPGKGMEKLLDDGSNILTNVKSTKASMVVSIINIFQKKYNSRLNFDRKGYLIPQSLISPRCKRELIR
jgi:hypothetical protein